MKRTLSLCAALAMTVTLFAGCSSGAANSPAGYAGQTEGITWESGVRETSGAATSGTSQTDATAAGAAATVSDGQTAPVVRTGAFTTDPLKDGSFAFEDIVYQPSANNEFSEDYRIYLLTSVSTAATGEVVTAGVYPEQFKESEDYFYCIVDWGDGTWSYNGPYQKTDAYLTHAYKTAGTYQVRGLYVNLNRGTRIGWTSPQTIRITGSDMGSSYIHNVEVVTSGWLDADHTPDKAADNDSSTAWVSPLALNAVEEQYIGYLFDDNYRLDTLEFQVPADADIWPNIFSIEYTTDGGETWYSLPKYYYVYPHMEKENNPYGHFAIPNRMNFPNPQGATIVLPLDGVVANGIRVLSKQFPLNRISEDKYMSVSEMRVTGDKELLFYTSAGGTFDADLNNMWTIFGSADTEPIVTGVPFDKNPEPFRSGCQLIPSIEWLEWDGMQQIWRNDNEDIFWIYQNALFDSVVGPDYWSDYEDGYVYAIASMDPGADKHLGDQHHYVYNSILILAARNYLFTRLGSDIKTADQFFSETNNYGQTMEYKLEKAMDYMLTVLQGESGVLTILDPENDGTTSGKASNYWDVMRCCGYKSAYENVMFYRAVLAMADIMDFRADAEPGQAAGYRVRAQEYRDLAAKIKVEFNKTFWDEEKGRYITSINAKGVRLDFGLTFVNFMAAAAGLPDEDQARLIYEWIDGDRIIEGETSTGEDILGHFKFAARSNTVDFSTVTDENGQYYWWDHNGALPCTPDSFGAYGNQMQNGGTIFYISYYEMVGRMQNLGTDNAFERFEEILHEFHTQDQLRVFPFTQYGGYVAGVIGEFPESGLVPLTFLDTFVGVKADAKGLKITPNLPSNMDYAGVREYHFAGRTYSIKADKSLTKPVLTQNADGSWKVEVPAQGDWVVTRDNQVVSLG